MRTLLSLGLVLGLAMVSVESAEANKKQTSKAKTAATKTAKKKSAVKTTSKKKKVKTTSAKKQIKTTSTPTTVSTESSSALEAAPAESTTTAVAPEAPAAKKPGKWSLSFYTENTANMDKVNDGELGAAGGETIYTYGYPMVSYKASDTVKLSLLQEFDANLGVGDYEGSDISFADTQFRISHSDLATLVGGLKVSGQLRMYVPTSQSSRESGQILYLRPLLSISKPLDRWTVGYYIMPRFYFQQYKTKDVKKDGALVLNDDGTVKQTGTSQIRVHQWIGADYKVSDKVTIAGSYGIYQGWWNHDPSVGVREVKRVDGILADIYADIEAADWVTLSIGMQTEDPMGGEGVVLKGEGGPTATKTIFDARAWEYRLAATFSVPL